MGILDRIFTAERTLRWVGKLARRQPLFISALKSALIQPEVTSMVQMSSYSQTIRRARPALASGIVPDAMLSRLTLPDDANPAGNVHGGVILHLCDIGGFIAASKHCNEKSGQNGFVPLVVQVEESEFLNPVYLGQAVFINAKVAFASERSVNVVVDVLAKNLLNGDMPIAHTSKMWYITIPITSVRKHHQAAVVPPVIPQNDEEQRLYDQAKMYYDMRKKLTATEPTHASTSLDDIDQYRTSKPFAPQTVGYSFIELSDQCLPSFCREGMMMAGMVMKLMDTCAGLSALRHCNSNVVTLKVSEVDFLAPIMLGDVYYVMAVPTFTSRRTIEISCVVKCAPPSAGRQNARTVVRCNFTFVGLGLLGSAVEVPQLLVQTDDERLRFQKGRERYEVTKTKLRKTKSAG